MSNPSRGVQLPQGESGSRFFHRLLLDAARAFPALEAAELPRDPKAFKSGYGEALVRFEAVRLGLPERAEVARHLAAGLLGGLRFGEEDAAEPLSDHLARPAAAPVLERREGGDGAPGLRPTVPHGKKVYVGREVIALAEELCATQYMTEAALAGIRWIVERAEGNGGVLDLRGHRFALLGASAELAPTPLLLAGGAEVLWIDVASHERGLEALSGTPGALSWAPGVGDVIGDPRGVAAAIAAFAGDEAVHVGMFAYAPGRGRELRLAATMDAIARSLPPERLRSVAFYVSPTTPGHMQPDTARYVEEKLATMPRWQRALERVRALTRPGSHRRGDVVVAKAVVGLQGLSYQATQYIAKMMVAETWATAGRALAGAAAEPVTISANVAGITNTRSLDHPLFQAAFLAAPYYGVKIFEPATTRALSGLLMLHDLLNPEAPGAAGRAFPTSADKARAAAAQQIHGGCYSLPWLFDATIRAAAVVGLAKRPSLLLALAPKRKKKAKAR